MKAQSTYRVKVYHRPGLWMDDRAIERLAAGLRAVAEGCFDVVPNYQCLRGTRAALADKVISVAETSAGRMTGFCSALLLDVPGVSSVLHLGLTCVHPDHRGARLTDKLTSRLAVGYLLRSRPVGRVWVTNVACVLSSVGSVALNFDQVYPSPFGVAAPGPFHRHIAQTISARYRAEIAIEPAAVFDEARFVFRGSVKGTVFQKAGDDRRFHHRDPALNAFYGDLLRFEDGDEVLQVGHYSVATLLRYLKRGRGRRRPSATRVAA